MPTRGRWRGRGRNRTPCHEVCIDDGVYPYAEKQHFPHKEVKTHERNRPQHDEYHTLRHLAIVELSKTTQQGQAGSQPRSQPTILRWRWLLGGQRWRRQRPAALTPRHGRGRWRRQRGLAESGREGIENPRRQVHATVATVLTHILKLFMTIWAVNMDGHATLSYLRL
jgi:hypothetical protein